MDPTTLADGLLRVLILQGMQAAIWCAVAAGFVFLLTPVWRWFFTK